MISIIYRSVNVGREGKLFWSVSTKNEDVHIGK